MVHDIKSFPKQQFDFEVCLCAIQHIVFNYEKSEYHNISKLNRVHSYHIKNNATTFQPNLFVLPKVIIEKIFFDRQTDDQSINQTVSQSWQVFS